MDCISTSNFASIISSDESIITGNDSSDESELDYEEEEAELEKLGIHLSQ